MRMLLRYLIFIICFCSFYLLGKASNTICFSSAVPLIFPYWMNYSLMSGFHLPFADFAACLNTSSVYAILTGTRSLSANF